MDNLQITVQRKGTVKTIEGKCGASLLDILIQNDIYIPAACGGKGRCGKCGVRMTGYVTEATPEDKKFFKPEELEQGWRLSCLSYPQENCNITVGTGDETDFEIVADEQAEDGKNIDLIQESYMIGIDIGTTTIAVNLIGGDDKKVLHTVTTINRQRAYGADVISRIQASNDGKMEELKKSIRTDLYTCIQKVLTESGADGSRVKQIVIAGNTTMGHLFMGYSCETLGVFPFTPVNIGTITLSFKEAFAECIADAPICPNAEVILMPGISTYVGADIVSGLLACDFDQSEEINVLIDLGTNGEMAIGNKDKIMVTSTAAGPAFEGGNISCGMGSVKGAICKVEIAEDASVTLETIGQEAPIGLCGTGVIESVYELIQQELVDETGLLDEDYFDDGFVLAQDPDGNDIYLSQKDVREIQLAKSAVRAGLETLILRYGTDYDHIANLYLAGGFGYKINLEKAIGIGLLPEEMHDKIKAIGNSSLTGTGVYLNEENAPQRTETIVSISEEIGLASDKDFNRFYTDFMFFE